MTLIKKTEHKIKNIVFLIKIAFLFFSTVCIFISKYYINPNLLIYHILHLVCFSLIILMFVYTFLRYTNKNNIYNKHSKTFTFFEDLMFFLIYILTLLNSGGHDSNFKLLFLFIIITSSIEFRMKTSFCYAILSTISLLILDLWYGINYPLNIYFKKELLISCSFFFSSILIGYFVNFAKSNINNLENLIDTELISFKKNNKFSFNDLKLLLNKSFKDNTNICVALISVDNINFDDFNSNKYNPLIDDIFKIIKYHLNNNDILVPYKKNILILILPSKNEIDALNLCHNIVATANDALISGPIINSKYNFNFSIGISCSNNTVYNEFDLISYARIALKHAKLSKNNKIIPYSYIDEFNKKQQIF